MTRYELFYSHGGLASAIIQSVNYALGTPDGVAITLRPYMRDFFPAESLQIIREKHNCFCSLCVYAGKTFLHVRMIKVKGY